MIKKFEEFINESYGGLTDTRKVIEIIQDFCNGDSNEYEGKNMMYICGDFTRMPETIGDDIVVVSGMEVHDASSLYRILKDNSDKNIVINDVNIDGMLKSPKITHILKCAGNPDQPNRDHQRLVICPDHSNNKDRFEMTKKLIIISAEYTRTIHNMGGNGNAFLSRCLIVNN